mmetsp:Transcript_1144/g.2916  ORF Transcript_1144/g.2916 Transcript_1144/m.2916 type:complete len:250 (+) Transcript_1144:3-752(+)
MYCIFIRTSSYLPYLSCTNETEPFTRNNLRHIMFVRSNHCRHRHPSLRRCSNHSDSSLLQSLVSPLFDRGLWNAPASAADERLVVCCFCFRSPLVSSPHRHHHPRRFPFCSCCSLLLFFVSPFPCSAPPILLVAFVSCLALPVAPAATRAPPGLPVATGAAMDWESKSHSPERWDSTRPAHWFDSKSFERPPRLLVPRPCWLESDGRGPQSRSCLSWRSPTTDRPSRAFSSENARVRSSLSSSPAVLSS